MSKVAASIKREIDESISTLVSEGLVDDQEFPSLTTTVGTHKRVAGWQVRHSVGTGRGALIGQPYVSTYEATLESRNFAMRMIDGAVLQLSYSGTGEAVVSHRLAYLPAPDLLPYVTDPELYVRDSIFLNVVGEQVFPVPLRFDFDARPGVHQDRKHPISHLTLGQYKHCRIPVSRAVTPVMFISFVMDNFYTPQNSEYLEFTRRVDSWDESISVAERTVAHFITP